MLGSVEVGKIADLVLWEPAFFGAKPKLVLKNGVISWAVMGDPNASLPTPQPVYYRPMFGAFGKALPDTCITFVSGAAHAAGIKKKLGLDRQVMAVRNMRKIGKRDMVRNSGTPKIEVEPGDVRGHGRRQARHRGAAEDGLAQPEVLLQLTGAP